MIRSFKDRRSEQAFGGRCPKGFPADLLSVARRKLAMIDAAHDLRDLAVPPANRLEALKGSRSGLHSIWINDQFRVCFRWSAGDAYEVEIVDYH
ncbi:MAG TPA: type II toxin-antitoxin system RelE/ParE family toxin [Microvirga sp.]|nr:type II toxin-antitoxin system RelE/ParE family toxin [Microvirga sp.]